MLQETKSESITEQRGKNECHALLRPPLEYMQIYKFNTFVLRKEVKKPQVFSLFFHFSFTDNWKMTFSMNVHMTLAVVMCANFIF